VEIRRLLLFVVLATAILIISDNVNRRLFPPAPEQPQPVAGPAEPAPKPKPAEPKAPVQPEQPGEKPGDKPVAPPKIVVKEPRVRHALGSLDPQSKYPLVIYLDSQGAAVERVELVERDSKQRFKYRNLLKQSGYLGHLALSDEKNGGCRINLVVPGSPAALAECPDVKSRGLAPGDIISQVGTILVTNQDEFLKSMNGFSPGETVEIQVRRSTGEETSPLTFTATLTENPMELIAPKQHLSANMLADDGIVPSFLMGLNTAEQLSVSGVEKEVQDLPSLRTGNWKTQVLKGPAIEFRFLIDEPTAKEHGLEGALEITKRYTLTDRYHLDLNITVHNLAATAQKVAYRLDGPNGLPLEGWWYSNKVHPKMFRIAGSRDIIWRKPGGSQFMHGGAAIHKERKANPKLPGDSIAGNSKDTDSLDYIGVDTQYFAAILMNQQKEADTGLQSFAVKNAATFQVGEVTELKGKNVRTVNSSFYVVSPEYKIATGKKKTSSYRIFLGPKHKEILKDYGLQTAIEYGWFSWVVKPMSMILHLFHAIVGNFGIAIVMLTIVVRGAMFPISRKATRGAQMMQFLAPEMKKITEKYKNDMEKRSRAQRELFGRYNYNPFSGCLLMFFQLPVFIGLYRCLSVDIELRDAPLISGIAWCSNLAAPDMFWHWESMGWDIITSRATGWLGPFFNILPIITITLFILQQKMFTPPATDDQTRMQQKMMKYMMVFMGILFFKVASGLCLYFIISSAWGIAERKLLPKVGTPEEIAARAREKVVRSGKKQSQRNENGRQKPVRKKKGKNKR
jgi:YidC/Oxa1 family membrane protein insertase